MRKYIDEKNHSCKECEDDLNIKEHLTKYSIVLFLGLAQICVIYTKDDFSQNIYVNCQNGNLSKVSNPLLSAKTK